MTAKAIVDSVVESTESAPTKTPKGLEWRNSSGKFHRIDGPAREWDNGTKEWWVDGWLHREDGPAVDEPQGQFWFVRGLYHRTDGPAIEWADGSKEWYVNGHKFTEDEFHRYVDQDTGEIFLPPGRKLDHDSQSYE